MFLKYKKEKIKFSIKVAIGSLIIALGAACLSNTYYKDLLTGKLEFQSDVFELPVENVFIYGPDKIMAIS